MGQRLDLGCGREEGKGGALRTRGPPQRQPVGRLGQRTRSVEWCGGGLGALHALDLGVWSRGRWGGRALFSGTAEPVGGAKFTREEKPKVGPKGGRAVPGAPGPRRVPSPETCAERTRELEPWGGGGGGIQRGSAKVLLHLPAEDSPSPKGRWGCQASRTEAGGGRGRACGWELNGPEKAPIKLENYGET